MRHNSQPSNKALHQTRRGGAVASRPVVEARLAGEGWCCTDRRTDQRHHRASTLRGRGSSSWLPGTNGPAWAEVVGPFSSLGLLAELAQPSSNIMSAVLDRPVSIDSLEARLR